MKDLEVKLNNLTEKQRQIIADVIKKMTQK